MITVWVDFVGHELRNLVGGGDGGDGGHECGIVGLDDQCRELLIEESKCRPLDRA